MAPCPVDPSPVAVPDRIAWALSLVDPSPGEHVLEVGCGPGVAAALVADRLGGTGHLTAIDRSATAVARTSARTAEHVAPGVVVVQQVDLARFAAEPATVDKAFAIDVNVFWTGPAAAECAVLGRVVRPGGRVWLVYSGPGERGREVAPGIAARLAAHGFASEVVAGPAGLVCVTGRSAG